MPQEKKTSRAQAAKHVKRFFGPQAFCRKKSKTTPGTRCQVALKRPHSPFRMDVVGAGRTWEEAFASAAVALGVKLEKVVQTPAEQEAAGPVL